MRISDWSSDVCSSDLTSVASVIQYSEILRNAQTIYYANSFVIELLFVAAIWYLAVVTVLSVGQHFLERYFAKGHRRPAAGQAAPCPPRPPCWSRATGARPSANCRRWMACPWRPPAAGSRPSTGHRARANAP